MVMQNKRVTVKRRPLDSDSLPNSQRTMPKIIVIERQQTLDEQHQFQAATDALLTELVRQQLGRRS